MKNNMVVHAYKGLHSFQNDNESVASYKGLVNLQNIFKSIHDLNHSIKKAKMLKTPS